MPVKLRRYPFIGYLFVLSERPPMLAKNLLLASLTLALCTSIASAQTTPTAAEDTPANDPAAKGSARDQAAIDDALHGWWTAALATRDQRLDWWRDARFGCFMHWGVYSELGGIYEGKRSGSYSEHIMRVLKIPRQDYLNNVVATFDPEKFDATAWVKLIKDAGMKYLVITAKHHDGFAMYPSEVTKYNIHDATKFKRDPMQELSDACHAAGIRFGFYYSHAFDWEDPNAPGNDWDYQNPGGDRKLFGGVDWYNQHPEQLERIKKYVDGKAIPQLLELIKKYHPDIFWFDTPQKLPPSEQIRIVKAVRAADPDVVINGRAARDGKYNFGDYLDTADNPAEVRDPGGDWEAIPTVNSSYGYSSWDNNYKTPEFFIQLLAKINAKGGNMLLNIGPKGDGTIDVNATRILEGIGKWMAVNGDSIHGTTRTPLDRQAWGDSSLKGSTLYLHVFQWPTDGALVVGGLKTDVNGAYLLADADKRSLQTSRMNPDDVLIHVPPKAPDATDSVVVLQLAASGADIQTEKNRLLATDIDHNQLLTFDATAHGKFAYGDGKAARYDATGFKTADDSLAWPVRTNSDAAFTVTAHYLSPNGGKLQVKCGDQTLAASLDSADKGIQTVTLGTLTLKAGTEAIDLRVNSPESNPDLQLFDLTLTPIR
jgi:alpha-L-fucosidase